MSRKYLFILISCLIWATVGGVMAQTQTPTPTPEAIPTSLTVTLEDGETVEISTENLEFILEAAEGQEIEPPMTLDLPEDWMSGNGTAVIQDIFGLQLLPFTIYTGPVTGGEGFIVLIWGYETTGFFDSETGETTLNPYTDALRLLHFALIGPDCVPGVDVERDFEVGEFVARGSNFAAYRCTETQDTRGWFVGLQVETVNMSIYAYTEPIEAMDGRAPQELQAILDTAEFDIPALYERLRERHEELVIQATATAQALTSTTPEPTATGTP
jgi:hypothetical protein